MLLLKPVRGTMTQDSVWYHLLQSAHSIHFVFGSSGILQMLYTGTSSTDLIVNSVAHLSLLYENTDIFLLSKQSTDGDEFSPGQSGTELGALQKPAQ